MLTPPILGFHLLVFFLTINGYPYYSNGVLIKVRLTCFINSLLYSPPTCIMKTLLLLIFVADVLCTPSILESLTRRPLSDIKNTGEPSFSRICKVRKENVAQQKDLDNNNIVSSSFQVGPISAVDLLCTPDIAENLERNHPSATQDTNTPSCSTIYKSKWKNVGHIAGCGRNLNEEDYQILQNNVTTTFDHDQLGINFIIERSFYFMFFCVLKI